MLPIVSSLRAFLPLTALVLAGPGAAGETVSFRTDVMPVLSKAGCNLGTCHGNQNGKNGFKLSLRGQDAGWDHAALTRDTLGRRVNTANPAESLLLRKAAATIPHEGGRRFGTDAVEYALLARWMAEGARDDGPAAPRLVRLTVTPAEQVLAEPADAAQLKVVAAFADGRVRDVTRFAVFEPSNLNAAVAADGVAKRLRFGECAVLVRYLDRQAVVRLAFVPAHRDFHWNPPPEANYVDRHVFAKLKALRVAPSAACDDATFLRRVYLDVLGVLPTAAEARAFLADTAADKRARLIDAVLRRPEFADFWALKWSDLLRNEEKQLDRKGVEGLHQWLRQAFAEGRPLNEVARDLVAGQGSTYVHPEANFYRALREPMTRAEAVGQVFLGVRLQCARCHNHPFERWTQQDYHAFTAFFARIQYAVLENNRRDKFDKHEFEGEQVVWQDRQGEWTDPRTGRPLPPRFLGAAADLGQGEDRLRALADWIADPGNPFFARVQANRVWFHLLGRGLVEPIDDFRASNPPAHPALLDDLARDFAEHQFDLRHLIRMILNSTTYQLAATPNATNRDDEANGARALVRPLPAEVLLDALAQVTGTKLAFNGYPSGLRACQLPGVPSQQGRRRAMMAESAQFLKVFGKPDRLLSCECERSEDTTLGQAFQLLSGPLLNDLLARPDNRLGQLLASAQDPALWVEDLYLTALTRYPTPAERQAAVAELAKAADKRAALEDLTWGLVNAKEFLLRR